MQVFLVEDGETKFIEFANQRNSDKTRANFGFFNWQNLATVQHLGYKCSD
jgi:hypothetical protein